MWKPWDTNEVVKRLAASLGDHELTEEDLFAVLQEFDVNPVIEQSKQLILAELQESAPRMLAEHREDRDLFESRLELVWGPALDLSYQVQVCCQELGSSFNDAHRAEAATEQDEKFEAMIRIHARACNVHADIHTLLRTGFPDAALARWRALHELSVVAELLGQGDNNLAHRFLTRGDIEAYKDGLLYNDLADVRGWEPIDATEIAELKSIRDEAVQKFGKTISDNQWGWAGDFVNKPNPSFVDIEKFVSQSHLRPEVRLANHYVHGGASSARLVLTEFRGGEVLQSGPTNFGLTEPAHCAAISLFNITATLIVNSRNYDYEPGITAGLAAVAQLVDDTGDAFLAAHEKLERMETEVRRESEEGA